MSLEENLKKARIKPTSSKDAKLDDALDDSFPASDPPAMTVPKSRLGSRSGESPAVHPLSDAETPEPTGYKPTK